MTAILHATADLPCAPERAFTLFTDARALETWLASRAEVEAHVGGRYELYWNPADPSDNHTRGCRITALEPGELLAFDWRGPSMLADAMNEIDPLTHVVVSFHATPAGTRVHLVHTGWPSTARGKEARKWFTRAWAMAFESLSEVATAG